MHMQAAQVIPRPQQNSDKRSFVRLQCGAASGAKISEAKVFVLLALAQKT